MTETKLWFGKNAGKEIRDVSTGYLKWMVEKIDPVPLPKYQFNEDGTHMTLEQVEALTERFRCIIDAASEELAERGEA